ncbi:hypothetical protein FZC80_00265 [Rossellomorea aquimaris]|uniref:Helix-hairpin-helix DNA-binding motif class 1 domain-containing protein n=2 Tax=Bacillaceae TaxID=186817 RepID=A0A5D4U9G1_9BACI|nr:hypothetical protein FZC80_00265 [Rossellomorea aquimaris]
MPPILPVPTIPTFMCCPPSKIHSHACLAAILYAYFLQNCVLTIGSKGLLKRKITPVKRAFPYHSYEQQISNMQFKGEEYMLQSLLDKYKILIIILIAVLMVLFILLNGSGGQSAPADIQNEPLPVVDDQVPSAPGEEAAQPLNKEIFVDVKGAVHKPGIYKAVQSERVNDLIIRAGGFTAAAQDTSVNLAQRVTDEMVIYVPEEGEPGAVPASVVIPEGEEMLDINQAEALEFESLPGIGPAKAKAIFDYRSENGPFQTIEELMEVSGIGEGTFDKLKENITVN